MNSKFYYCKTCKKAVPVTLSRCDGCGRRFKGDRIYSEEQIQMLQMGQQTDDKTGYETGQQTNYATDNQPDHQEEDACMICPVCKTRYDRTHDICDSCHMPLQLWIDPIDIPEEKTSQVFGMGFGDIIDQPKWEFKTRRYMDGQEFQGVNIKMNRTFLPLGRYFFIENAIFSADKVAIQKTINRVSKYNVFMIVKNGDLYIQYDDTEAHRDRDRITGEIKPKAKVSVNGEILKTGECKQITVGDTIILGAGKRSLNNCVSLNVSTVAQNISDMNMQQFIESNQMMQKMMQGHLQKIEENSERSLQINQETLNQAKENAQGIQNLSDIDVHKFKTLEAYDAALVRYAENDTTALQKKSKEEYINEFLGEYPHRTELLQILSGAQRQYLYYAAYYEYNANQADGDDMDYSACFIYMGKLLENLYTQKLCPIIQKYAPEKWTSMMEDKERKHLPHLMLGSITSAFIYHDKETDRRSGKGIIKKICSAYTGTYQIDQNMYKKIEQTFIQCDKAKGERNGTAHGDVDAIFEDDIKTVSQADYMEAKKNIIESDMIIQIEDYYNKIMK